MTTIYKVRAASPLHPSDPYHVSRFFAPDRKHRAVMQDRQDLILYLANLNETALTQGAMINKPRGFCEVKLRLTSLREWVHDYKVVFDHFFEVKQFGYHINDGLHDVSTLIPKKLGIRWHEKNRLTYVPPERPDDGVVSKVYIHHSNSEMIRRRLADDARADLAPAVEWLLNQKEVNFIFQRAGKLQQRDTSVWPVAAIETWPSWLREALFGPGIDIDSAYTQYLMSYLQKAHSERPHQIEMMYPDLVRSLNDKMAWRHELCRDVLGLPITDENIGLVKKLCMSLANGSRISPAILIGGGGYSVTADVIIKVTDDVSPENLERIGRKLGYISKQYIAAKKAICNVGLCLNPTRRNQKKVFGSYFTWEREARYLIWEAVDCHGIMVHDGIDGVPQEYIDRLPQLVLELGIKMTT